MFPVRMMPWAHAKRSPEFRDPQRTRGVSDLDSGTMAHPLQAMLSAASCEGPCLLRETSTSITRACFPKPRDAGTKMRRFPPAATQAHKDLQKPKRARFSAHARMWPSAFIRQNSCMHHLQRLNILTRSLQQKHSTSAIPAFMVNSASSAPGVRPPLSGRRPVMTTSGLPVTALSAITSPFAFSLHQHVQASD